MKIFPHRTEPSRAEGASKRLFPSHQNDPGRPGRVMQKLRPRVPLLILSLLLAVLFLAGTIPTIANGDSCNPTDSNDLQEALENCDYVTLGADITGYRFTVDYDRSVTLDLNRHTIDGGQTGRVAGEEVSHPVIFVNGDLTLTGSGTITGGSSDRGGGISIDGGILTMECNDDGCPKISGNYADSGGGVLVRGGGTFTMNAGTISGNKAVGNGGEGGGIAIVGESSNSTFIMNDGTISDNEASSDGGGVAVGLWGDFTMNAGTISDNKASSGGGVNVDQEGTFYMYGGTISGNEASNGGGVNVSPITFSYGTISAGTFTMTAGTITGNKAEKNGGGVSFGGEYAKLNLSGSSYISGNLNGSSKPDNLFLLADSHITVTGAMSGQNPVGVTMENGSGVFTNSANTGYNDPAIFTSDDTAYVVGKNTDGQLLLVVPVKLTYDANGGEGTMTDPNSPYAPGSNVKVLHNSFTRTGYSFTGWNTEKDGNGTPYKEGESLSIESETVLYAQWAANTYTVLFDGNGGDGTMASQAFTYDEEQNLAPNAFRWEGHSFSGWKDGNGKAYADGQSVKNLTTEDQGKVTLSAQWDLPVYTVTVTTDGKDTGTAAASPASGAKGTEVTLNAVPAEGYRLKEWQVVSGGVNITGNSFTIGDANVEIKAVFEKLPEGVYSVTVSTDGNGTASASHASGAKGTKVTLSAKPAEGYRFKEWQVVSGGVKVTEDSFTISDANVEVKAVFAKLEKFDVDVNFVLLRNDGTRGVPFDIKEGTLKPVLTIKKRGEAAAKSGAMEVKITAGMKNEVQVKATFSNKVEDLAPGKYEVSVSGLPKEMEKEVPDSANKPKYKLTAKAEINLKDKKDPVITVYLIWEDMYERVEPVVYALPEDEIGAYWIMKDGTKEYLLFHTYDICMEWLGSEELCEGPKRCFHKDGK